VSSPTRMPHPAAREDLAGLAIHAPGCQGTSRSAAPGGCRLILALQHDLQPASEPSRSRTQDGRTMQRICPSRPALAGHRRDLLISSAPTVSARISRSRPTRPGVSGRCRPRRGPASLGPGAGQVQGDGLAESRTSAGHDGSLRVKPGHVVRPSCRRRGLRDRADQRAVYQCMPSM